MNSEFRSRVSLGDAVGPMNTRPGSLINIESAPDDPLLLFTSEQSPVGRVTPEPSPAGRPSPEQPPAGRLTPGRQPAGRAFDVAPAASSALGRLELAPLRSPGVELMKHREPWAAPRPAKRGGGTALVVATLVLGILGGFAGGYTRELFIDAPPAVVPPRTSAARADQPMPLSAASASASVTRDAWEHLPVGTQSQDPVAVEPDSGTATNLPAPRPRTAASVASAVATRGSIEVVSRPSGAEVALDGRIVGTTPVSIPDVTEGTHVVGIELAGFNRWATSVYVNRGQQARVGASLAP
jgi:hypothetical protein